MASSIALQLCKSSWPSQILLVYRLGKASTTPETRTLPAPNHTPFGRLNTPTSISYSLALELGRHWQEGLFDNISDLDLGRWIYMVLEWTLSKRLGLALLQRQSASQDKHGSMGDSHFPASVYWVYLRTKGQEAL